MGESLITAAIVLAAALWCFRWFRGAAGGKKGCSCGSCGKTGCASRTPAPGSGAGAVRE